MISARGPLEPLPSGTTALWNHCPLEPLPSGTIARQAKLLVSRRHAFFTKICVSPAGRVCVYSSLILSTFFSFFFQLQYSCIFHCKALLD